MRILITGAKGFIGQNLFVHLSERVDVDIVTYTHTQPIAELESLVSVSDFIFHLASVNRPKNEAEFEQGNNEFTEILCQAIEKSGKNIPVIFSSSIQAELDNPYGESKRNAEERLLEFASRRGNPVFIFRLPNVFGKWCKPNYNSVVATFCHNIARHLPIQINEPNHCIRLAYIDDVVKHFIAIMDRPVTTNAFCEVTPTYDITVGDLAEKIKMFKRSRESLIVDSVGTGLERALHSTYLSYIEPRQFSYLLTKHADERGVFVEMLKTTNSGQFSFFTAYPGITRGGHYHHSKTEKFLVVKGRALFKFRQIVTGEAYEIIISSTHPEVVETVPGWTHDITNIGDDEMIVMLWANEVFDNKHPDTYIKPL